MVGAISRLHADQVSRVVEQRVRLRLGLDTVVERTEIRFRQLAAVLGQLDPRTALARGYALVFGPGNRPLGNKPVVQGDTLRIETNRYNITAGVTDVTEKHT